MEQTNFSELVDCYDGFLLDQWGVLHNGITLYEGIVERLLELREKNKKVVLLSNSGKSSLINSERLSKLGILPHSYDGFVTSGEVANQKLKSRDDVFFQNIGTHCMAFVRGGETEFLSELNLEFTEDVNKATFLLMSGVDEDSDLVEKVEPVLKAAATRKLPMICTNPDTSFLYGDKYFPGSGTIAKIYEKMGQEVLYIGKPHSEIFKYALEMLDIADFERILMVGDSLEHDIKGANLVGIDSALVIGGLHSQEIKKGDNSDVHMGSVKALCEKYGAQPDWLVQSFG